jgi:hypothetical protein
MLQFVKLKVCLGLVALCLSVHSNLPMEMCKGMLTSPAAQIVGETMAAIVGYSTLHCVINMQVNSVDRKHDFLKGNLKWSTICGLVLGLGIAAASRIGSWPKLDTADLFIPALCTFGAMSVASLAGSLALDPKEYNNKEKHARFFGAIVGGLSGFTLSAGALPAYLLIQRYKRS